MSILLDFISDPEWRKWFEQKLQHPWRVPIERWGLGFMVAVLLICIGGYVLFTGHASLPNALPRQRFRLMRPEVARPPAIQWDGNEAIAIGLTCLFFGLALHLICFWGRSDRVGHLGHPLGLVAAMVSILSFVGFLALNFIL